MHRSSRLDRSLFVWPILEGLSPILLHQSSKIFPPLFFLFCVNAIAAIVLLFPCFLQRSFPRFHRIHLLPLFGLVVFNYTGYALLLVGSKVSTGVNTTIALQSEVLWTFLFASLVMHERVTFRRCMGALAGLCGVSLVAGFSRPLGWNGEWLMILGTLSFTIGNACAKHLLRSLQPMTVLFGRYLLAAPFLFLASILFREPLHTIAWLPSTLGVLLIISVGIFAFSKIYWYRSLRRYPLHIVASVLPVVPCFSIVAAWIFLGETLSVVQGAGLGLTLAGMWGIFGGPQGHPEDLGPDVIV